MVNITHAHANVTKHFAQKVAMMGDASGPENVASSLAISPKLYTLFIYQREQDPRVM